MNDLPFHLIADEHETFTREEKIKEKKEFLSSLSNDALELYEAWVSNPGCYSVKFTSFFRAYADILSRFRDKEVTIAEIGVLDSGSLLAWQKWFGNPTRLRRPCYRPECSGAVEPGRQYRAIAGATFGGPLHCSPSVRRFQYDLPMIRHRDALAASDGSLVWPADPPGQRSHRP